MILLQLVSGLRKTLNDCSAEQKTAGVTLRITTTFPNLQRALSPKKIGLDNITLVQWP